MKPYASEHEFLWFTEGPDDSGKQWRTGERMTTRPDIVEMAADNEDHLPLADMASNNFGLHVYSPKLRATFEALGVTNIEYLTARLVDKTSGAQRDDYRVANYLGKVACLDFDHAVIHKGTRIPIVKLERFALHEDRIVAMPGMNAPPRIFRLEEFSQLVIAHASIKAACERDRITGVTFTPTTEYA
jgi:hypothetical protein